MDIQDRIATYRFLSIALQDPFLGACLPTLPRTEGPWTEARGLWDGIDRDRWARLFRSTFGHTAAGAYPPYETHYGQPTVFEQTNVLADVAGFYRSFGLRVDQERGEGVDHIGPELEFAGYLLEKQRMAPDPEKAEVSRDVLMAFVRDHLGTWGPSFGRLLARNAPVEEYRTVGRLLDAFLAEERVSLGLSAVDADRLPQPVPPLPIECGTLPCGGDEGE